MGGVGQGYDWEQIACLGKKKFRFGPALSNIRKQWRAGCIDNCACCLHCFSYLIIVFFVVTIHSSANQLSSILPLLIGAFRMNIVWPWRRLVLIY